MATINLTKVGVGVGVGAVDEVLDGRIVGGPLASFRLSEIFEYAAVAQGFVPSRVLPYSLNLSDALTVAALPLATKSILRRFRRMGGRDAAS